MRPCPQDFVAAWAFAAGPFQKPLASEIAYPTENVAFVENDFEYSTGTLSHELFHLGLEELGCKKSCYVDKVHENQFRYEMIEMG